VYKEQRLQVLNGPPGGGRRTNIEGASWWPLDNFKVAPPEIDSDVPMAVHCKKEIPQCDCV
jgi:hypothetical protein